MKGGGQRRKGEDSETKEGPPPSFSPTVHKPLSGNAVAGNNAVP